MAGKFLWRLRTNCQLEIRLPQTFWLCLVTSLVPVHNLKCIPTPLATCPQNKSSMYLGKCAWNVFFMQTGNYLACSLCRNEPLSICSPAYCEHPWKDENDDFSHAPIPREHTTIFYILSAILQWNFLCDFPFLFVVFSFTRLILIIWVQKNDSTPWWWWWWPNQFNILGCGGYLTSI